MARKRNRPFQYPINSERDLKRVYTKNIQATWVDVQNLLLPHIRGYVQEARLDEWGEELSLTMAALLTRNRSRLHKQNLEREFAVIAEGTNLKHFTQWLKWQSRNLTGVLHSDENWFRNMSKSFVSENVRLITRVTNEDLLGEINRIISQGVNSGASATQLTKEIQERVQINKRHARLIARDQVTSLFSQVNKRRQQEIGITEYIWRTMDDERVRPKHVALDDTKQSWSKPTNAGFPGTEILCRCFAEPVINEKEVEKRGVSVKD